MIYYSLALRAVGIYIVWFGDFHKLLFNIYVVALCMWAEIILLSVCFK